MTLPKQIPLAARVISSIALLSIGVVVGRMTVHDAHHMTVIDFGAVGDGITDDTAAFNNALKFTARCARENIQ